MNIIAAKINDKKYVIVDTTTGEILADNYNFGYSSKHSAYEAFAKHKTNKQTKHKINLSSIIDWCRNNQKVIKTFNYYVKNNKNKNNEYEKMLLQIIFREFKIDESYLDFSIDDLQKFLLRRKKNE